MKKENIVDINTFISRLEEVRDIGRIENGYSHIIYNVMHDDALDSNNYMLVDVSTYKRTKNKQPINQNFLGENPCAVPDFVIIKKIKSLDEQVSRLGCIEVKFEDNQVNGARNSGKNGYLKIYKNHVIYTNGWIWKYYNGKKSEPDWKVDFRPEEKRTQETYNKLIELLKNIEWNK